MTSPLMSILSRSTKRIAGTAAILIALSSFACVLATAQTITTHSPAPAPSRVDIFGGYSYFHPVNSDIGNVRYQPINPGAVTSISGYFTRNLGIQAEGSFFPHGPDDCVYTAQAGPVFRIQRGRFVPFAHALIGGAKVGGPVFQPCTWGLGITGGIGFDYIIHGFGNHIAIRPIQADYDFSRVNYGPLVTPADVSGGLGVINAYRLSAGVVLRFGDMGPKVPVSLTCSAQPQEGFAGDPVVVTAIALNIESNHPVAYTWKSTGGKLDPHAATIAIATQGAQPGTYTVTGHVSQGTKPFQSADCSTTYTIRAFDPPTVTCSANPSSVIAGASSTITSIGRSPQNRPLTYSFSADSGEIASNSNSATLRSATAGTIAVTCNVVDDLGKAATATTSVTASAAAAPAAPPAPMPVALCSVNFDRDPKRPSRVNNEAKACLDDIALSAQRQSQAKLVLVGNQKSGESDNMAAQRAINVKQYLVVEKGIDATRIEVRTGSSKSTNVDTSLLPLGATFSDPSTKVIDVKAIHPDHVETKRRGH